MEVKLVLLRHGESEWNQANRFTGWTDVALSERGIQEAHRAGHLLRAAGYVFDPHYAHLEPEELPVSESLKDTLDRVLPYWHEVMAPALRRRRRLLVTAHGNSLRALVKYLDHIAHEEIPALNIPTGFPLVYELSDDLEPIRKTYLGDPKAATMAAQAVANQAAFGS